MKRRPLIPFVHDIDHLILTVRDRRVILDADLAVIYGVSTRRLNEQVKRNGDRFPPDFAFQLTQDEWTIIRAQPAEIYPNRSHFATGPQKHRDPRSCPRAFTEHGAIMAANVLKSPQAAQMSVFVVRAFVKLRTTLADSEDLARKLAAVEAELKSRLDVHEAAIVEVLQRIMQILAPTPGPPLPPPPEIGFHVKETCVPYCAKVRSGAR